jgi:hypothetical protein
MHAVRRVFDPDQRVNPGKVVPLHACREWSGWVNPGAMPPGPGRKPGAAAVGAL